MARKPEKAVVIVLDSFDKEDMKKYLEQGFLPNLEKIYTKGVVAEHCFNGPTTAARPNWEAIATGAISSGYDNSLSSPAYKQPVLRMLHSIASLCDKSSVSPYLWDTLDNLGWRCVVFNYPGSWKSKLTQGILVHDIEQSMPAEIKDGIGRETRISLCHEQLITTFNLPEAIQGSFKPATDWKNVSQMGEAPMEMAVRLNFPLADHVLPEAYWYVLIRALGSSGYDTLTLSPAKDFSQSFCTVHPGQWSEKIHTTISVEDNQSQDVVFQCKLLELSENAEFLRLYISPLCCTDGWTEPAEATRQVFGDETAFGPWDGFRGLVLGWYEQQTFTEIFENYIQWLGQSAATLLEKNEWDLFFMHTHSPNRFLRRAISFLKDKNFFNDPELIQRIYIAWDRMFGKIFEAVGKKTLLFVVTDNTPFPRRQSFDPCAAMRSANLLQERKEIDSHSNGEMLIQTMLGISPESVTEIFDESDVNWAGQTLDLRKSTAYVSGLFSIKVNTSGKIVLSRDSAEADQKTQREIIGALLGYKDSQSGLHPVKAALSKEDTKAFGIEEEGDSDVMFALRQDFTHPPAPNLLMTFGPGLTKGARLSRNVWMADIVPTLCYLLDMPLPENTEGAVLYQTLKNQNMKQEQILKMKGGINRMKTAAARGLREPWEKHDCA